LGRFHTRQKISKNAAALRNEADGWKALKSRIDDAIELASIDNNLHADLNGGD